MAKKDPAENGQSVNKSQAIRDVFAATPKADSKTVIAALAGQGVKVSPTMVYYVRSKLGQARRKAERVRLAESAGKLGVANPVELVLRVKDLAQEVGGIQHLKQLVDLLAE